MKKSDYITKEYFDKTLDKKLDEKLDEKLKQQEKVIKQHMTDLNTGYKELLKVVRDQVVSVDERVTGLDVRLTKVEKLT